MDSWLVSTVTMDMRGTATTSASQPSGSAPPPCPRIAMSARTTGTALGKCILQSVWFWWLQQTREPGQLFFSLHPIMFFFSLMHEVMFATASVWKIALFLRDREKHVNISDMQILHCQHVMCGPWSLDLELPFVAKLKHKSKRSV